MRGCLPPESGLGPAAGVKRNLGAGLEKTVQAQACPKGLACSLVSTSMFPFVGQLPRDQLSPCTPLAGLEHLPHQILLNYIIDLLSPVNTPSLPLNFLDGGNEKIKCKFCLSRHTRISRMQKTIRSHCHFLAIPDSHDSHQQKIFFSSQLCRREMIWLSHLTIGSRTNSQNIIK